MYVLVHSAVLWSQTVNQGHDSLRIMYDGDLRLQFSSLYTGSFYKRGHLRAFKYQLSGELCEGPV